jgi:prepilin-type N-terminal cleavage/methylation domain-containing protein/prepilin-type processing-associated H-X9-DG protein
MRRRAFTLTELLVVIAIIALLFSISLPVLRSVRQSAWSVRCQANVRQLQIAFQSYESQNQTLPFGFELNRRPYPYPETPNDPPGTLVQDNPGWWWFNELKILIEPSDGWREAGMPACPCKKQEDRYMDWDNLCGNYGANRDLCPSSEDLEVFARNYVRPPVSTSTLRQPGSTVLVMDAGYALLCWWHAADDSPVKLKQFLDYTAYVPGLSINKNREFLPGQVLDAVGGRHPNKTVNVGFADGHIEKKKAEDLLVEKIDKTTYKNKTPLWAPK